MTDERMGDALWPAIAALPRGAGIVFRHFGTPLSERHALFARILRIARRRRLTLIRAGRERMVGEMGIHGPGSVRSAGIRTWPAHSRREAIAGIRADADLLFVSPVFPTRTHPGEPSLGPIRAALMVRGLQIKTIALGGMSASRARSTKLLGFYGWAAIDAWQQARRKDQKRKAVPI
ncbi:thiamine phosphate synthase [Sphingomonas sp. So64.6b]|nr:thiamine phosphate synthase [Sphingomonas sp. So64.6b]QNA87109.1 thiamine phosphate synthase [Sphingomonas sp. So64.6b]